MMQNEDNSHVYTGEENIIHTIPDNFYHNLSLQTSPSWIICSAMLTLPPFCLGSSLMSAMFSTSPISSRSSLLRWYTMPAPRESPNTLMAVRNLIHDTFVTLLLQSLLLAKLHLPVQQPVHGENEGHGLTRQPTGLQDHHHGHQTRLAQIRGIM